MKSGPGAWLILRLLRVYKTLISPLLIPCCRFTPSCSTYTYEAVSKYGAVKGMYLGIKRIVRCNPFCKGGYDPVR